MENTESNQTEAASDLSASAGSDPIVQVSGFGVENTMQTQCNFLLVGLTKSGKVVLSTGDGIWSDVSPKPNHLLDFKCAKSAIEYAKNLT